MIADAVWASPQKEFYKQMCICSNYVYWKNLQNETVDFSYKMASCCNARVDFQVGDMNTEKQECHLLFFFF